MALDEQEAIILNWSGLYVVFFCKKDPNHKYFMNTTSRHPDYQPERDGFTDIPADFVTGFSSVFLDCIMNEKRR